jgi:hypothetical protein
MDLGDSIRTHELRPQFVPQGTEYALRTYCINFFSDV